MDSHRRYRPGGIAADMEEMKQSRKMRHRSRAVEMSKRFHGFSPRAIKELRLLWPKALVLLGPCTRVEYYSRKFDDKGRVYYHDFENECLVYAAESPQKDGSHLLIIHGHFKIEPEGITG